MLSVIIKSIMVNVIMLNVVAPYGALCQTIFRVNTLLKLGLVMKPKIEPKDKKVDSTRYVRRRDTYHNDTW